MGENLFCKGQMVTTQKFRDEYERIFKKDEDEMKHFIKLCKICGEVISQCRCISKDKVKFYGICKKCEGIEVKKHEE